MEPQDACIASTGPEKAANATGEIANMSSASTVAEKKPGRTADDWREAWRENSQGGFHLEDRHTHLENFLDVLTAGAPIKILFPLCGKSVDMKWLHDLGHTVVGVEVSECAIQQFGKEQEVTLHEEVVDEISGKLFKTENGRLRLYSCDFFDFTSNVESQFDAIFDRAALQAIDGKDRPRYIASLYTMLKKDGKLLLITGLFDQSLVCGPPHSISHETVDQLFGDRCNVKILGESDGLREHHRKRGLTELTEVANLITFK